MQSQRDPAETATSSQSHLSSVDPLGGEGHDPIPRVRPSRDPKMARLKGRLEDLERVFTIRALDHAGEREIYSAQPMLRDGRAALNKTRIFGRSHWLNTAYQVCCNLIIHVLPILKL